MNERSRALGATTHPLVLAAAALIVVNDFVLRGRAPGWLTGKLSDVGWLIVAPVFVAALFALVRVPRARLVGFVASGTVYVALQVWPPLGAFVSAGHVADLEDLWVLPAMFGAVVAWRTIRARAAFVGVPVLASVLLGDILSVEWSVPPAASWPCGEGMEWESGEALRFQLEVEGFAPAGTEAFARGLRLTDKSGTEIPLVLAYTGGGYAACARDGLRGDSAYTWEIGPWASSTNQAPFEHPALPTVQFRTLPDDGPAAADGSTCAALISDAEPPRECGFRNSYPDTGDSAETGAR